MPKNKWPVGTNKIFTEVLKDRSKALKMEFTTMQLLRRVGSINWKYMDEVKGKESTVEATDVSRSNRIKSLRRDKRQNGDQFEKMGGEY